MHYDWLIIDGNNLIHSDPELTAHVARRAFDQARMALVQRLSPLVGELCGRMTVVFDGRDGTAGTGFEGAAVEVRFSPSNLTADAVIERLVRTAASPPRTAVVSSDRMERDNVEAAGVHTISCLNFLSIAATSRRHLATGLRAASKTLPRSTLGEFYPKS